MLNLFKRPIHKDSIDSWAKCLDDVAKVALLAVPVVVYNDNYSLSFKIIHSIILVVVIYMTLVTSSALRTNKEKLSKEI